MSVAAPVQANFTAQPTDLTVQFTDQSSGQIAQHQWDFGDNGGSSTDQNPQYTYSQPGTYTVTLTVTDVNGQSSVAQQQVNVAAPVQANFTAQPTDLSVQFTDQSTGQIAQWQWDFGDNSGSSTDQNPQYAYSQAGTYTVTLTVTDANGQSSVAQQQVTLNAAQRPPSVVDSTPILPDFNALHDVLRGIYANGVNSMGVQATVFSMAGDSILTQPGILSPFASGGQYNLNNHGDLQAAIDWFNTSNGPGGGSFSHSSLAVNPNWTAQDLLNPANADPSCSGDSPLACELHQLHPTVMLIAVGANDARNGTDAGSFAATLSQIVSVVEQNGAIPVLLTIPDDGSSPNTEAINEAIITVAQQNSVPLLNAARALNELSNFNLDAAPNGPGALGNSAVKNYGINALNLDLLQVLSDARNIIFPDA